MKRLSGLLFAAGSVLGLFAASAQALPPIMDRVPAGALIVVTTPSLEQLEKGVQSITTTLEIPFPGVKNMLMMKGIDAGVDMTKPIAAIVMPPSDKGAAKPADKKADANDPMGAGDEQEEPPTILMIPTGDYKALLKAFNAEAGAGITEFTSPEGDPAFAKDLGGGYAAICNKKDVLEKFDGKGGNAKSHSDLVGKVGDQISEKADLVVVANIAALGPIARPMIEKTMESAMEGPMMMMGGGGAMAIEGAKEQINAFLDQTSGAVLALDIEPSGVALDASAQFKPGTKLAEAFSKGGNSGALIAKLPNQPYLLNYALDLTQPAWKKMVKDALNAGAGAGAKDAQPTTLLAGTIDSVDGAATSIGFSPTALFGGGLLVNTTSYFKSSKPADAIAASQKMVETLNGKTVAGNAYTGTYTKSGAKVNNVDVDVWEMKMTPAGDDAGPMSQAAILFGPAGGPGGFLAPVEGGVVGTMAKNQQLMTAAMDAAGKGTNSMADDAMTKQVSERLPKSRLGEAYIGIKSIMESVKPMLAMAPGGGQFDIPEQLPPVGAGVGAEGSAAHAALFVPMPVIKTVGAAVKSMNQPPAGAPAPAAQPGQPAGQPRF
jgi:hypothetical protein